MKKFEDKVVWITGASSGIGKPSPFGSSRQGQRLFARNRDFLELVKSDHNIFKKVEILEMDLKKAKNCLPK